MANKPALFEKFINDIKRIWRTAPRGLILWNLTLVALMIVPAFYSLEVFIVAQILGSFCAFGIMLDNDLVGRSSPRNLWALATAFSWVMLVFMLAFGILEFVYKWTFGLLIKQDEIRVEKYQKEILVKKFEQLQLGRGEKENQKFLSDGEKNNQKLLGN